MRTHSLDEIYAAEGASSLRNDIAAHRQRVEDTMLLGEPVYTYWWDKDITGLVLFTDRRIIQIPRFSKRSGLFGFTYEYDTWTYPYETLEKVDIFPGSILELPRLILARKADSEALIIFNGVKKEQLHEIADNLRSLTALWQEKYGENQPQNPPTVTDAAMRLRELYDLYQSGILDEDAYRRAKARLMAD